MYIFGPPRLSPVWHLQHRRGLLVSDALITHAKPGYAQNVADSIVPEFVDEMARSLREGSIFATLEERGADADEEKSPLNVPRQLARTPNRFQRAPFFIR